MMATASVDETVKIWDIAHSNGTDPKQVAQKKMNMGEIFTLSYYQDIPWVLAAGGSKGELAIWDTEESEQISKHFSPFLDKSKIQN
jgi:periodic tryptophan protein 1